MAQPQKRDRVNPEQELGGGSLAKVQLIHNGKVILEAHESGFEAGTVTTEPTAGKVPIFFFRDSGGKQQLCVLFSSGATQIIATEP